MLTELQYFGTISYIKALNDAQNICFDTEDRFTKMGFKNRTIIASAQGPLNLTIPIIGGRDQKNKLQDIISSFSLSKYAIFADKLSIIDVCSSSKFCPVRNINFNISIDF
jgi:hypothetical protein